MWCSSSANQAGSGCLPDFGCLPASCGDRRGQNANGRRLPLGQQSDAQHEEQQGNAVPPTLIGESHEKLGDVSAEPRASAQKKAAGFTAVVPDGDNIDKSGAALRELASERDDSAGTEEPITEDHLGDKVLDLPPQHHSAVVEEREEPAPEHPPEHELRGNVRKTSDVASSTVYGAGEGEWIDEIDKSQQEQALKGLKQQVEDVEPNCWERHLAGDILCGGCGCATWLLIVLVAAIASSPGLKFSEGQDGWDVLDDVIVQEYYVYTYVTQYDNFFLDAPSRRLGQQQHHSPRRLETSATADRYRASVGDAATIIYEAVGTECPGDDCNLKGKNLLTPEFLPAMKEFEATLWGDAENRAKFCQLIYAEPGTSAAETPRCTPPQSLMQPLFFSGTTSAEETEALLKQGFGRPERACLCRAAAEELDEKCVVCSSPDAQQSCAEASQQHIDLPTWSVNASLAIINATCNSLADPNSDSEADCGFAPPRIGSECSSPAWSHIDHSSGELVQESSMQALFTETCSGNADFSMLRDMTLPNFACQGGAEASHLKSFGTPFLRSFIFYGAPVSPGESPRFWDDETEATYLEDEHADHLYDVYIAAQEKLEQSTGGKVRAHMLAGTTVAKEVLALLRNDGILASLSFVLVFSYMWFTVESLFIAVMGMVQVLLSFPPAALLWYMIKPDGIASMQLLCLFLILGIGADDVFVLFDAWKQHCRAHADDPDVSRTVIFASAYRRAFSAMAATTFTTAAAFLFGMFSRIDAIKDFCTFAAFVVVFDFLWCITLLAASIAFYDRYVRGRTYIGGPPAMPGACCQQGCCFGGLRLVWRKVTCTKADATTDHRKLEEFVGGPLFNIMFRFRFILLAFWLVIVVVACFVAGFGLTVATDPPDFGDQDVSFVRAVTLGNNYFSQPAGAQVHVYWGVADEPVKRWRSTNPPEPEPKWRSDFAEAAISTSGQEEILRLCTSADEDETVRCEDQACLVKGHTAAGGCPRDEAAWENHRIYIPADPLCQTGRYCFMEQVKEYADFHSGIGFPVPPEQFMTIVTSDGFSEYMDLRDSLLRERMHWDADQYADYTGIHPTADNRLGFMHMTFNATFPRRMSRDAANNLYDHWESFVETYAGSTNPAQVAGPYLFMVLQNELLAAAFQGIATALSVSLACLVLVTFNWYVSLLGFVNITCILIVFLGAVPLIGWELGVYECIFLIMTVGLSVDYTVHLLHAYNESSHETRKDKVQESLASMGITVLSGAATTLLASLPLFGCKLRFFQQYGVFIFFTILFSIILAISFLPPLLMIVGPEQSFGKITPLYRLAAYMRGTCANSCCKGS